jgi:hypothetical protein
MIVALNRLGRKRRKPIALTVAGNAVRLGEWYMVHDDVWKAAGMETMGGALCIGCLEERLGRDLTADDFKDCPLNDLSVFPSASFSSRLRTILLRKNQTK